MSRLVAMFRKKVTILKNRAKVIETENIQLKNQLEDALKKEVVTVEKR